MVAKVVGELPRSFDPAVSEWGNPPFIRSLLPKSMPSGKLLSGSGEPSELKHLSRVRKIKQL